MKSKSIYHALLLTGGLLMSMSFYSGYENNSPMSGKEMIRGIEGRIAPELSKDISWIDGSGQKTEAIQLSDYKNKFKVIYCFQSWCPGCHSRGLPDLKKMVNALKGNDKVVFFAIQTVFEGFHTNTEDKILETQKRYDLEIPFGHDVGSRETGDRSHTMFTYQTGGTPWFIFVNQQDTVIFNDFHLDSDKAIEFLKGIE